MQNGFLRGSAGALILLAGFSTVAQAEIYRWVDENGVVNYSDKPPKDVKAEEKSFHNVATPFREPPKDLYRKPETPETESVAVEAPPVDTAPAQESGESVASDLDSNSQSNDGTLSRKDAVKYNDSDKQSLSERKSSINKGNSASSNASSSISDTKKAITSEYNKAKEAYRNRNENL